MSEDPKAAQRSISFVGAHNELAGLKDRVLKISARVSAIADHLSGPEPAGGVMLANKPQPAGLINQIFDGIDDLGRALDALEYQIDRVHDL